MRIIQFDEGKVQRHILMAMIVSREVALGVAQWWKPPGLFPSKQLNLVGNWCVDFVRRYDRALGRSVQAKYEDWVQARQNRESSQLVEAILRQLSDDYARCRQDINVGYTLDRARTYFNRVAYRRHAEALKQAEEDGDLEKCETLQREFQRAEEIIDPAKDLLLDESLADIAFADRLEPIIEFPGDLGLFYGNAFGRACFVSFLGPVGRGKTFSLLDAAWRGLLQQRRVAFIETGDMTEAQIYRRFAVRAARRPLFPKVIKYPTSLSVDNGAFQIEFEEREYREPMDARMVKNAMRRVLERDVRSHESRFKLLCRPAGTLTVAQLRSHMEDWERRGFVADVVVIDYADLMSMPYQYRESRDKINALWVELRAFSEEWNCCLVTATQANRESMRTDTVSIYHASEDIRKTAAVTAMYGLSQIDLEKRQGVMRYNTIKDRDDAFVPSACVYVASCLALSNPCVRSALPLADSNSSAAS